MGKFTDYIKDKWKDAVIWLLGSIILLLLTKTCDSIWPSSPIIVKDYSDTVRIVHTVAPLPEENDSVFGRLIEQQLKNIELLNRYEEIVTNKREHLEVEPCKMIVGNPDPSSSGYAVKSSSSYCFLQLSNNAPFIDINYSFVRTDYSSLISTLRVEITKMDEKSERIYCVFDQYYEPQINKQEMLIRIVDDLSPGDYTIEAGFYLKNDVNEKYPSFYRHCFSYKKKQVS